MNKKKATKAKKPKAYSTALDKKKKKKSNAKTEDRENHPTTQKMLALDAALEKKTKKKEEEKSGGNDATAPSAANHLLQGANQLANKKGQKVTKLAFDDVPNMCVEHVGKEVTQHNLVSSKIR